MTGLRRAVALLLLPGLSGAAEVTTVADVRFFGGQHFYGGRASAVAGNLDATLTPAFRYSDRWSLVPTWRSEYRGTRSVQELAGGGTLFQDSTRQSLTAKLVRTAGPWKHKLTLGAAAEWLRETKDEDWGKGLFDNRKLSAGLETQRDFSKETGLRLAYDHYLLTFPNYTSLESASDPTLARELAGEKVLDSGNHLVTFSWWSPFPGKMTAALAAHYNLRAFADQPVIGSQGQPTGTDRSDKTIAVSAGLTSRAYDLGGARIALDLGLGYAMNESDQNHFDADKVVFLAGYYDHAQWSVRPQATLALGTKRWILSAAGEHKRRNYADRPIQDPNGDYLSEKTWIAETSVQLGLVYPYSKTFKLRAQAAVAWSDSNQRYEKTFRYNYKIANYMIGFSYEY